MNTKRMTMLLAISIYLLSPLTVIAGDWGVQPLLNLGTSVECIQSMAELKYVPDYVRSVPDILGLSIIQNSTVHYPNYIFNIEANVGIEIINEEYALAIGGKLNCPLMQKYDLQKDHCCGVNSFTYYGFCDRYVNGYEVFSPGLYIRPSFRFGPTYLDMRPGFFMEYGLRWWDLDVDSGWGNLKIHTNENGDEHKYYAIESWRKYKLADMTEHKIKVGVSIEKKDTVYEAYIGYSIQDAELTELARESDLEIDSALFAGFKVSRSF